MHDLRAGGEYLCVDHTRQILEDGVRRLFGGDPYALCRAYFRTVCESIQGTSAQVLGHIELVMKFNEARDLFDDADARYLGPALETAELAARSGRFSIKFGSKQQLDLAIRDLIDNNRVFSIPGVSGRRCRHCGLRSRNCR